MVNQIQAKTRSKQQLLGLEAGRGIAALLVLLCHCGTHCRLVYGQFLLSEIFTFGHAGVDFFFVLSGFIIFNTHWGDIGQPRRVAHYFKRRITRIYPLYWIVLAATLLSVALSGHAFPSLPQIVVSALLLPTLGGIIVGDAWTLQHEMLFYGIFAALLLNKRLGLFGFGIWLAFLLACTQVGVPWQSGLMAKLSSYFNVEFFFGIGAAWLVVKKPMPVPRLLFIVGLAGFLTVGTLENLGLIVNADMYTHFGYGLSATIAVIGLVNWERHGALTVPPVLITLGSASYAIYLVHLMAIATVWQIIQRSGYQYDLGPTVVFLILSVTAASAGVVASIVIEKPVMNWVRRSVFATAPRARSQPIQASHQ